MDDSLTNFQETKKINPGPKISKAVTKKKPKTSKTIKGQKDIRIALNTKEDELIVYTKQFDQYCRKSGIDVDPEQLEIAIALSKSLQTEPLSSDCTPNINTQEKTKRIQNTLQEYGFKVPKTKSTSKKNKKKHNKYKLLSCTNAQRLQVISDRYAQVLFQNVCNFRTNSINNFSNASLYYISTNISYKEIKNDEIFYVDGLIDKSKSIGSLLRNWADIPDRPVSPINIDYFEMNFNEIECSQDELDLALSGPLKSIKNIIVSKQNENSNRNMHTSDTENNCKNTTQDDYTKMKIPKKDDDVESQILQNKCRSCSPDLFEDDVSTLENDESICENKKSYVMDLTECVNINMDIVTVVIDTKGDCEIVNKSNISRRKSDDVMEITECVASTSRFNNQFKQNYEIDLTQSSHNVHTLTQEITRTGNKFDNNDIDLTQSSNSSNDLPIVHLPEKHSLDDTIIINACDYENIINTCKTVNSGDEQELIDLTQDCKATGANNENSSHCSLFEDYVYGHSEQSEQHVENKRDNASDEDIYIIKTTDSLNIMNETVHENFYNKTSSFTDDNERRNNISITELNKPNLINITCDTVEENVMSKKVKMSLGELNESKSQVPILEHEQFKNNKHKIQSSYSNFHNDTKAIEDKIDLTQQSFDIDDDVNTSPEQKSRNNLGKKYKVSIDYDEIFNESKNHFLINGSSSSKSPVYEIADELDTVDKVRNHSENNESLELSQHSEVFEIIDYELNYSIHKSRYENFNTSAINEFAISQKFCDVIDLDHKNEIANDLENLPEIDLKEAQEDPVITSTNIDNENLNHLESPQNSKYIIKTREVTPIKDFALMSTPERNKELDKYGIKPFKRKRAIQLLTHIYNQTHPIVEDSLDCVQSPSKKTKRYTSPRNSPKMLKSPKKNHTLKYFENNENIYEVTNEMPVIREFECSVEDWVFQKREKAKVHSCRVPLHVAFHNYVLCRRGLREAILRYEPVNIDIIHKELVGYGHRYDPKDLLRFMDKKCITVKTTDNGRNNNNITKS